jgi:hypothetical protein
MHFMKNYREPSVEEMRVKNYESRVNYIYEGYEEIIYEYLNDLACRLFIEESIAQGNENILPLKPRIDKADERLKAILRKTNTCIYGNYPESYFWFWGIPQNSTELMNEARLSNWI